MSSSSSDDEFFLMDSVWLRTKQKQGIHPINRERKMYGEYHHLFTKLKQHEDRFFEYMRMSFVTFKYILEKIEVQLTKTWCNWHKQPILPEERLVITIRYLATGCSFKSLAFSFRMGASTVGIIISETVKVLWEQLQPIHMPIPTKDALKSIANDFYDIWNFPHVIGSIDGKHVRVLCPANSGSMFFNYKHFFSVVLQGVVDANYKLIAIDVGGYGKQSDGGTFKSSDFYKMLITKQIEIPEPTTLPGTNIKAPYVLLGDEAYPLLDFLLKPYGGQNLPLAQECFNKRLSRARKTIECTFGILYSKWRILSKAIETDLKVADNIIKCTCILHNTILDKEGFERHLTEVKITPRSEDIDRPPITGRPTNCAKNIRDIFTSFISQNPLKYQN